MQRQERPTREVSGADAAVRRRGFTLLEILTVIAILGAMLAMLGVTMLGQVKTARTKATTLLVQRIETALARYEADFRCRPPDTGYGLPLGTVKNGDAVVQDSGSLWRYLAQPLELRGSGGAVLRVVGPYEHFSESELLAYDDPVYGKSCCVADAWGRPVGYVGDRQRVVHNRGGADIYSMGPDGKTASINNWGSQD
jgi:prepilin-type N-terminal cleavage/methylation domain-containing protein